MIGVGSFSTPFWTLWGPRCREAPGTHFRIFSATLGPKGPNDPCSRARESQGLPCFLRDWQELQEWNDSFLLEQAWRVAKTECIYGMLDIYIYIFFFFFSLSLVLSLSLSFFSSYCVIDCSSLLRVYSALGYFLDPLCPLQSPKPRKQENSIFGIQKYLFWPGLGPISFFSFFSRRFAHVSFSPRISHTRASHDGLNLSGLNLNLKNGLTSLITNH